MVKLGVKKFATLLKLSGDFTNFKTDLKNSCLPSIIPIGKINMHENMLLVQRAIDNESFTIEISIVSALEYPIFHVPVKHNLGKGLIQF